MFKFFFKPKSLFYSHVQDTSRLKNIVKKAQFPAIITTLALLAVFFYYIPGNSSGSLTNAFLQMADFTSVSSSSVLSNGNGIGGGDIIGNCTAGKKNLPIYSVDKQAEDGKKYVSLSFDAAWGADDTIQILDILDKYNVKVTFFMTGGWVDSFPDMVKEIYARGHDLGNHSQNHKQMSKLDVAGQKEELLSVHTAVKELTDYNMFLFRPPYGDYNSTLINTTYGCNYYPIQWSVDSLDWKDYGVDSIIKTVTQHKALENGAIILMHNGSKFTAQALESVITNLQDQGYTLIPISEMIIKENFHMDGTGKQIAD